jgi:hypothetical protein
MPLLSAGQKKRLQIHPAGLLITLLSFGAWVVALGGVGGATQNCVNGGYVGAAGSPSVQCAKTYQWEWWGLWFEGCLLVALFVSAFFEAFNKGKQVFISYFILCTMTLMMGAHNFITTSLVGTVNFQVKDKQQARERAWCAVGGGVCEGSGVRARGAWAWVGGAARAAARAPRHAAHGAAATPARTPSVPRAAPLPQTSLRCARGALARAFKPQAPGRARMHMPLPHLHTHPHHTHTHTLLTHSPSAPRTRTTRARAGCEQRGRGWIHHPVHLQLLLAHHSRL